MRRPFSVVPAPDPQAPGFVTDDIFSRANTAAGSSGVPTFTAAGLTPAAPADNYGTWEVLNNQLVNSAANYGTLSNPTAQNLVNSRSVARVAFTGVDNTKQFYIIAKQVVAGSNNQYDALFQLLTSGSQVVVSETHAGVSISQTYYLDVTPGHTYDCSVSSIASGANVILTVDVVDVETGLSALRGGPQVYTDTAPGVLLASAGPQKVGGANTTSAFLRWKIENPLVALSSDVSDVPRSGAMAVVHLSCGGAGTPGASAWTTTNPVFSTATQAGASAMVISQTITSASTATLVLAVTGSGPVTITDPTTRATLTLPVPGAQTVIHFGLVGDSLTQGTLSPTPDLIIAQMIPGLTAGNYRAVVTNQGHYGSSTAGWLPTDTASETTPGTLSTNYFNTAKAAFVSAGVTDILLQLGTNDASFLTAAQYQANLIAIISGFCAAGLRVTLNEPPYKFASSSQSAVIQAYLFVLDVVVAQLSAVYPGLVVAGDRSLFAYIAAHPELINTSDQIHYVLQGYYDAATIQTEAFLQNTLSFNTAPVQQRHPRTTLA